MLLALAIVRRRAAFMKARCGAASHLLNHGCCQFVRRHERASNQLVGVLPRVCVDVHSVNWACTRADAHALRGHHYEHEHAGAARGEHLCGALQNVRRQRARVSARPRHQC